MGANTHISWCDHTFNPWEGCTKVSPGCAHCYAEARNQRFSAGANWGKGAPRRRTSVQNWNQVRKWDRESLAVWDAARGQGLPLNEPRRPRVFVASLADWLDDEVPVQWLADLLALIHECQNLDFLLLTKRPESWRRRIVDAYAYSVDVRNFDAAARWLAAWVNREPPANVWIGTTVEDQTRANERIPALLSIPARVRFLSCEPLLGPVDLINARGLCLGKSPRLEIDWVICGGESGPGARPMHPAWARMLRAQCADAGVPFHFKQWGEWIPGDHVESLPDHEPKRITQIALDGTVASSTHMPYEKRDGMKTICLVGKHITGRLLDGVEHLAFPEARA